MSSGLFIRVLGAAAGGGFPQWNCNCDNCAAYWQGEEGLVSQTQSSLAISANGDDWVLLNASPDIRKQIENTPALWPKKPQEVGKRHSPIKGVLLTNGDIDHTAGLLTLREKQPFNLLMTSEIAGVINGNAIFNALDPEFVKQKHVNLNQEIEVLPDLKVTIFSVPGKVPLYMETDVVVTDLEGEQTVGVKIRAGDKTVFYIPGCAKMTDKLRDTISGSDLIMFDGTLWRDDEMIVQGVGVKTGNRMGHMSMSGDDGTLEVFKDIDIARKIFIHMNNTNPVLNKKSEERKVVENSGWEIAFDGMEITI